MLHPQQGTEAGSDRTNLQIGGLLNSMTDVKDVPSETSAPQGVKRAFSLPSDGTAGSRALPEPATADIKQVVREKYGQAALRVKSGGSSCCGAAAGTGCADPITTGLYDATQSSQIP